MSRSVLARRGARASLSCKLTALLSASAIALATTPALAQSNWQTGVSGDITDYNNTANWDSGIPPTTSGQIGDFGSAGSGTIVVTGGSAIAPDSWNFSSGAQAYTITGAAVNFGGDGVIDNATNAVSIANNIGGTGGVAVGTNASLTLSGNNTYSGGTQIDSGTLIAGSSTAFSANSIVILNGNLDLNGFNNTIGNLSGVLGAGNITNGSTGTADILTVNMTAPSTYGGNISDGGNPGATTALAVTGNSTLTLTGVNSYTGGTSIGSGATLQLGDGTNTGTAGTGAITDNGTLIFNPNNATTNFASANAISGSGAVTIATGATVTLSGNNTYAGLTTVDGTLKAGSTTAFGLASGNGAPMAIAAGGVLDLNGFNNTVGVLSGSGSITNNGGSDAVLTTRGGIVNTFTYSGNLTDGTTNKLGLTRLGSGTLILSGNNTYSGPTNILSGTITAGSTTGLSPNSAINVSSFTNLNINGFNSTIAGLTGSGNVLNGGLGNATLTVNVASGNDTFSGALENSGQVFALTKTGAGTLTLNDAPGGVSYSGDTNIMGGTLQAGGVNSLTPNSNYILAGGATLDLNGNSNTLGGLNGTGTVTNTAAASTATLTVNNGGTFNGNLSDGAGTLGLTVTGPGSTLTLTGIDNYSGATTVTSGTLVLGSPTALPNTSNLAVNGTLDLGGFGGTTPTLTGSGTITNNGPAATIVITGGGNTSFSGVIQDGTGTSALALSNASYLTLTGANTFSGGTQLTGDSTLTIGGTTGTAGSGNIAIGSGSQLTLSRTGTYTLANTITGAGSIAISAGSPVLTSTSNTYGNTLIAGGNLQIGDGGNDGSLGTGTITMTSGALIIEQNGTYTIPAAISNGGVAGGTLGQAGTGTTIVSNTNQLFHVSVTNGILEAESAGALGSASVAIAPGGTLEFNVGNNNYTYSNTLTGSGTIAVVTSNGGVVLSGNGTGFTGTVTIDGTSQLAITPTGVGSAAIIDNGSLGFNAPGAYSNAISGSGSLHTGLTIVLTGNNSYGNTAINFGGSLQIGANGTSGTLGTGAVDTGPNGTLIFSRSNTMTVANTITDGGAVVQNGSGTTILTGTDSWSGGTTISNGTLQIGNGGTTGSVGSGPVTDNAALAIDHSNATNISTAISGSGTLTQMGSGTVTITVAQTYTGATIINSGTTLALTGSGDLSQSAGVADNGTFDISGITAASESLYRLQGSGVVALGTKGLIITGPSGAFTGTFTGSGALNITGTETLSGNNSAYSGAVTISSGATVTLGGGTNPLGTGSITDSGTLAFAAGTGSITILANAISGTGAVNAVSGATLLTGANSYSGTTTIASGAALDIGNNGTSGTLGSGNVVDNGYIQFNRTDTNTYANVISGSGNVNVGNSGNEVTILTGANTYSGLTTINSGATLQIGNGGTAGALGTGAVTDNGTLAFDLSGSTTAANAISGTGGVNVLAGTVILTAADSYSGTTGIASGTTLTLSGSGTLGTGAVTDNGTLNFNDTGTVTAANAISGSGALTASSGTTILTGANSYSGTTTIASGATLQIGAGAASGTLGSGAVTDNGSLTFANLAGGTVANAISGTGSVTVNSTSANTIFTGANSYSGTTTISGFLQIGNGGTTGTLGTGAVTDNGTLTYNRTDSVTLSTVISGTGGLVQSGSGTLIVDGVNTFTGNTDVRAGILEVGDAATPGAKIGTVSVESGATLSGHGTTGTVTVASGGKVQPGGTIGTLTVNGNFSLPAGSTLVAEVSPSAGDKVAVSGTATLGGALQIVPDAGTYSATDYKLISATTVSGTFSSTSGSVSGFTNTVQYSATGVDLILSTPATTTTTTTTTTPPITTYLFGTYGQTPNQIAAGNALAAGVPTGALYVSTGTVVARGASAVPEVLTELSGDIHSSIRSAAIEDSRIIRDAVLNELGTAAPRGSDGIAVWGTIFGGYGSIAGGGNATGLHHDSAGSIAGADIAASDNLRIGIAGAYSDNNASTNGKLSTAKGKMGNVIGYAGYQEGVIDLKFGAAYSFGTMHILRNIASTALVEYDSQSQHGSQIFGTAGYLISSDLAMVEPYLGLANISATSGAFSETGNVAALSGASKTNDLTYGTVGMKAKLDDETLGGLPITPRIDLGWQHAFNHLTPGQSVTFLNAGTSFTTLGVPLGTDAAAVQIGFDLAVAPDVILSAGYDGSFSSTTNNNAIEARINLAL